MKIFITGVAGFLGSHLADRMIELGHTVVGNDNMLGGYIENINPEVEFHRVDCCDYEAMVNIMRGCDVVCHAAATAHEGFSLYSPHFITTNIYGASVSTITAAIKVGVKKFVYCSSMARYGNLPIPFVETQIPQPVDPYGIAKVAGEDTLKCLAELHGMDWVIAIPHNVIGPRQKYDDPFRNVISIMVNRILQGKPPIVYGDGSQMRCFSYVDDCVFCLEKMMLDPEIKNDIFNIGPDEEFISIADIATMISDMLYWNGGVINYPDRPREIKYAHCDSTKAREILNYRTTTTLHQGIRNTIDYIIQRGVRPFDYSYPVELTTPGIPTTWSERKMNEG